MTKEFLIKTNNLESGEHHTVATSYPTLEEAKQNLKELTKEYLNGLDPEYFFYEEINTEDYQTYMDKMEEKQKILYAELCDECDAVIYIIESKS